MNRGYNFSAGPSMLPLQVLQRAASEMLCYKDTGQSVMEMSHRSPEYEAIIGRCEELLRELMGIPQSYKVLLLQGGASLQFHMLPLNLLSSGEAVNMVNTGIWTKKAIEEAEKVGETHVVASSEPSSFRDIPTVTADMLSENCKYLHICQNNTVEGTAYSTLPVVDVPIVSDMSSCILSAPVKVSDYGVIFAGAQKNMGCAGLTVVIIREDLIASKPLSSMLSYSVQAKNGSMFNTPPTYSIYICMLVLEWLKDTVGGLANMEQLNRAKADMLYSYLDHSPMFSAIVPKGDCRSIMNIPFTSGDYHTDKAFLELAAKHKLYNLKGHKAVGGLRASIYNAMPLEGVEALISAMEIFEKR